MASAVFELPDRERDARWLFGPTLDVAAFGGSVALGVLLVVLRRPLGWPEELPEWGWVAFVLGVDVAHVYGTLFRTYLDGAELRRHPVRYVALPLAVYGVGVALHLSSPVAFWRALAYLAVFHFVRQQIGWAALYRSRAGRNLLDRLVDDTALYAATVYPLVRWHAHLTQARFAWLVRGDFFDVAALAARLLPAARAAWVVALVVFAVRQIAVRVETGRVHVGKLVLVAGTAVSWHVGIVGTNGDFDFTVTNVLAHGVPYVVLVWTRTRPGEGEPRASLGAELVASGVAVFAFVLVLLAFVEEAAWDRLVWHDHAWLFGASDVSLGTLATALVVPLLAVPQATHYVLDGLIWRRREVVAATSVSSFTRTGHG